MKGIFVWSLSVIALAATSNAQVITTVVGGGGEGTGDNGPATSAQLVQPTGVAVDTAGNIYIADSQDQRVRKVNAAGVITTLAGTGNRDSAGDGGPAASAALNGPSGVAVDAGGNVYIADKLNHRIRKVNAAGIISTFAGIGTAGFSGDGGAATSAALNSPSAVAVDAGGNVYIADTNNRRVRKVTPAGTIATIAGNGNGSYSGDGGAAISAGIPSPAGVAFDTAGNLYVSDTSNRVRKVNAAGIITTVAGNGGSGSAGDGGPATSASLSIPAGLAIDSAGNLYIGDEFNNRVRKVSASGTIGTFAGGGLVGGNFGDGGPAASASLALPVGVAVDAGGNVFIADSNHQRIRKVSAGGSAAISVSASTLSFSYQIGGTRPAAKQIIVSSSAGTLTVSAAASSTGGWLGVIPSSGPTPLTLTVAVDPTLLTANTYSGTITITPPPGAGTTAPTVTVMLVVTSGAGAIHTVAGDGVQGCSPDGTTATGGWLFKPIGVVPDTSGGFYYAEAGCLVIRKVTAAGIMTTVAGNGKMGFSGDGGPATSAAMAPPLNTYQGIALDGSGNLYIADNGNRRIRKVETSGTITTVAGNGSPILSGDGGPAVDAGLVDPRGVAVDASGNLYIADASGRKVRKVSPDGTISTFAGTGAFGSSGDGGPAVSALLSSPFAVTADPAGNVYISDAGAYCVRKVDPSGIISTVAGNGSRGDTGDGGAATSASIDPLGIAADGAGDIFIADQDHNRIRKVNAAGIITTISGDGQNGFKGDGGLASLAELNAPADVSLDSSGNLYIADTGNFRIREISGAGASSGGNPAVSLVANAFGESQLIAPNTWVELKGTNLSSSRRIWQDADFLNNQLPTQLDGVSVTVNGRNAFVYYISPTQVNILTPPDALSGNVQVQLKSGSATSSMNVAAQPLSPSFFVFDGTHVTATHLDGSLIGPTSLYPGASRPAAPNETIILYANGLGPTSLPVVSGSINQGGTLSQFPVLKIGGITATVTFAGLVSPGLFQLNVVVPAPVQDGDLQLTGTYNGVSTQAGVILSVQH